MKKEIIFTEIVCSLHVHAQASCSQFCLVTEFTTSSSLAFFFCFLLFISQPNVLTFFLYLDQSTTRNASSLRDAGMLFEVMKP